MRDPRTADRVKTLYGPFVDGQVERYEVPSLSAFTFVMQPALGGGGTCSLALDPHGKTSGSLLLEFEIGVSDLV